MARRRRVSDNANNRRSNLMNVEQSVSEKSVIDQQLIREGMLSTEPGINHRCAFSASRRAEWVRNLQSCRSV